MERNRLTSCRPVLGQIAENSPSEAIRSRAGQCAAALSK